MASHVNHHTSLHVSLHIFNLVHPMKITIVMLIPENRTFFLVQQIQMEG
jgi:hypothetical protein